MVYATRRRLLQQTLDLRFSIGRRITRSNPTVLLCGGSPGTRSMASGTIAGTQTQSGTPRQNKLRKSDSSIWEKFLGIGQLAARDIKMTKIFLTLHSSFLRYRLGHDTVASVFQRNVRRQPDKVALNSEGSQLTFRQLEEYSNRVANLFRQTSLRSGDSVALFGTSSPEYVGIWLGLSKLQLRTALLNSNLMGSSLTHSISAVDASALIVDTDLLDQFASIRSTFPATNVYYYNSNPIANKPADVPEDRWLNPLIQKASHVAPENPPKGNLSDVLMYIYTSGTTGLPKASIITQSRFMAFSSIVNLCGGLRRDDVIYCPLPLYHTSAGITTIGQMLIYGSTVVVKKKFSATTFWDDVIRYKCTSVTYIGEICRYLLAQPPSPLEQQHQLRMAYGQGLRPALWEEFKRRFQIGDIREMYGSTEGNAGMANVHGKTGAVGYLSPFLDLLPVPAPIIVPIDKETGMLQGKNENGLYRRALSGEEGELLGPVTTDPLRQFDGYTDRKAGTSKILYDVLRKGDKYFRTGDILVRDDEGFVFFVDRFGDSFRWKGENVSTTEVEGVITKLLDYADVVVYGVEVPDHDGKAGMLCIAGDADEHVGKLYEKFAGQLPSYAIPVFLRFSKELDLTGTFKISKARLKAEGFSPEVVKQDKLYYLDAQSKSYKLLSRDVFNAITKNQLRF
ncbi:Long-chain fatty acid transport protein 4 [Hypsibius exemplaris]|uniref:Long-chain-fatty-acid--CoA ligase n=1 Tax=Hypsibius exemplaris TaxID=2072580 RepID=A0A1W0WTW5_HYPEX|nr:Long-chain fatty acid transport protein 4 [Hypsibius exemplaris]